MALDTALFVSKRASVAVAAVLCLMAARMALPPAGPSAASSGEVRVAITR